MKIIDRGWKCKRLGGRELSSRMQLSYLLIRNPFMKFQNPILNLSKFAKGNNAKNIQRAINNSKYILLKFIR